LAVQALLEAAASVGRRYRAEVRIGEGAELGVWSPRGKFAAVGVHAADGVLLHGLSVNGFRTETSFVGLKPCGLESPVDFLLSERSSEDQEIGFRRLGRELCEAALERLWKIKDVNEAIDESKFRRYTGSSFFVGS
jgi:lipoate-protein ligase B